MDVPLFWPVVLPGTAASIYRPGASKSRMEPTLEKSTIWSLASDVAPTLIALEIQAGAAIPLVYPLLPEAIIVAMPTERC